MKKKLLHQIHVVITDGRLGWSISFSFVARRPGILREEKLAIVSSCHIIGILKAGTFVSPFVHCLNSSTRTEQMLRGPLFVLVTKFYAKESVLLFFLKSFVFYYKFSTNIVKKRSGIFAQPPDVNILTLTAQQYSKLSVK